jgi:imidazolonepropionase-like amidohydrolase
MLHSQVRAIRAGRVFPSTGMPAIEDGLVGIQDGRVTGVWPAAIAEPHLLQSAEHWPTATLMPGLIDAHCHLTLAADKRTYEQMHQDPDEMLALVAVANLRRHLAAGVTTVRDNGGRNRVTFVVREAIQRGYVSGPRMLLAGRPITHTFGHFYFCNGVADGPEEIRAAIRALVAEGADHIKTMASGGATMGNLPYYASYTVPELRVAVETAHGLGRLTTAHCRATESMRYAVEAGLDCIEHAEFLEPDAHRVAHTHAHATVQRGRTIYDPRLVEQLLEAGCFISYTFQAGGYDSVVELRSRRDSAGLGNDDAVRLAVLEAYFDSKRDVFRKLIHDGAQHRLVVSSDAGPFDTQFGRMHLGLELAVEAGMRPADALEAATRVAAEACGVQSDLGTLEVGKLADCLVVDGNPLETISDVAKVAAVYQLGVRVV